jgi:trans-2,3-dihydro-3-hydroxyanthranilate isomerase
MEITRTNEVKKMKKPNFYMVDVFAEEKYAGNQLAVFENAEALSGAEMQKIAREIHYSETTFITSSEMRNGGYDVRIFTPAEEVPFAGHPTLGTAYVIKHKAANKRVSKILLNLKAGQIPVTFEEDGNKSVAWMKQIEPAFGKTLDAIQVLDALNLDADTVNSRFPIQEVSTGLPFIIVPLKTLDALKRARVSRDKFLNLIKNIQAKIILIFCPETYNSKNNLNVRVFADYYGIPEDPATGSGNGCLAGYLVKHRYFGKEKVDVRVEQGYEIGRPSLLLLRAENKKGEIDVYVGGKIVMIAKGKMI